MTLSHLTFVRKDNTQLLVGSPQPGVFIFSPENVVCDLYTASLRLSEALVEDHPELHAVKPYFSGVYRQLLQHLNPQRVGSVKLTPPPTD